MTTTRLSRPIDSWVSESKPAANNAEALKLVMSNQTDDIKEAYLFFGGGPRPGVFVVEATLTVFNRGTWSGSPTLTARAIIEPWKESTLTWRRRPDTTGTNAATLSPGALTPGEQLDFDVSAMVRTAFLGSGSPFFGFRLTTTGTDDRPLHSSEAADPDLRPYLTIVYSTAAAVPFDLVPGDGSVVSVAEPVLAWAQFDIDGDDQAAFRVQLDPAADGDSPAFDSGWITSPDPELDLADTSYSGLALNASDQWRVQTEDTTGQQSEWSEWAEITRTGKGTLTIDAPTSAVEEATPTIITTLDGQDQAALRYIIAEQLPDSGVWRERWDTGRFLAPAADGVAYESEVPSVGEEVTIGGRKIAFPPITKRDTPYRLTVYSWDDVENRVHTPGDPPYTTDSVEFTWVVSADAPDGPSTLTCVQDADNGPGVRCSWTRAAVPDDWALMVDGELKIDKVPALNWSVGAEEYEMTYYGIEPGDEHTIEILAIVVTT